MNYKKSFFLTVIASLFFFGGCLSKIGYYRYRPAAIDLSEMREISAFYVFNPSFLPSDFSFSESDMGSYLWENFNRQRFSSLLEQRRVQERMVAYGNSRIRENLYRSNYFSFHPFEPLYTTLGFSSHTNEAMSNLLDVEGVLMGKILSMYWKESIEEDQELIINSNGSKQISFVKYLRRDYYFTVRYEIIHFSQNKIIASRTFSQSTFDRVKYSDQGELRDPDDLFSFWLDNSASQFIKQLVPQRVRETFYLKGEKNHRELFDEAQSLALSGENQLAYEKYYTLWEEHQLEAAGYNASLLLEVQSYFFESIKLMEAVYQKYPTRQNKKRLVHLNRVAQDYLRVKSQL